MLFAFHAYSVSKPSGRNTQELQGNPQPEPVPCSLWRTEIFMVMRYTICRFWFVLTITLLTLYGCGDDGHVSFDGTDAEFS